jgi:hypothetical protein
MNELRSYDIRAILDDRDEKIGKKIRDAEMEKIWRGHFARSNDSVSFSKMCRNINTNNVISKMPEVVKIANIYLVRALNEGMADFFGYLHTRNPKWILPTAPQEYMRNLNFPSTLECTDKESQDWLSDLGAKIHLAVKTKNSKLVSIPDIHHYGASWAHFMYLTHQSLGSAINEITALRASVQFLEKLDSVVDKENGRNVITFGYLADLYLNTLATSKDIQVAVLDGGGERKGQVCTAAKQAFPQSEYLQSGYCRDLK